MISRLLLTSWLSFLLFSCEEAVDFPIPDIEQQLVILGHLSDTDPLRVTVTRTEPLLGGDTSFVAIGNAEVGIYQADSLVTTLDFVSLPPPNGLFFEQQAFRPQRGQPYELRVRAPGLPAVRASSTLPDPVQPQSAKVVEIEQTPTFQGERVTTDYVLELRVRDPSTTSNQYHLIIQQQRLDSAQGDGVPMLSSVSQPRVVTLEHNLQEVISYHRGGFLFTDEMRNGEDLSFRFQLQVITNSNEQQLGALLVELRATSDDYYRYHRSISDAFRSSGEPVDQPVIIYTNVENGYGIFGAYSSVRDSIPLQ